MSNVTGFSLADFADQVTDEIKALDSLLPPAGTFAIRCTDAALGENEAKEGIDQNTGLPYPPLYFTGYKYEILEAKPIDTSIDKDSLVGRVLNERYTFWPSGMNDAIGLLKGRYAKVGLSNTGRMGGLEGKEPGWIDGAKEHIFGIKIRHANTKDGSARAYYSWFALEVGESGASEEMESEPEAGQVVADKKGKAA